MNTKIIIAAVAACILSQSTNAEIYEVVGSKKTISVTDVNKIWRTYTKVVAEGVNHGEEFRVVCDAQHSNNTPLTVLISSRAIVTDPTGYWKKVIPQGGSNVAPKQHHWPINRTGYYVANGPSHWLKFECQYLAANGSGKGWITIKDSVMWVERRNP